MENTLKIKVKKLNPNAVIPRYAKPGDAGLDLVAQEYLAIADLIELRAKRIKTEQEEDNE